MKKLIFRHSNYSFLIFVFLTICFTSSTFAASNPVVGIEGMKYDVNGSLHANLNALRGKRVGLMLSSGTMVSGKVIHVGTKLLHLENLGRGKDFMDGLIRIKDIVGIEAQFRGYLNAVEKAGLTPVQLEKGK